MKPVISKRWIVAPALQDSDARDPRIPRLLRQLLSNRGLSDPAQAAAFLDPKLTDLPAPETLPGCSDAAKRVLAAVRDGRKIVIYGDYDVDGTTGSAILWHAIKLAGGQADYYIPHRLEEGYGLNSEALRTLAGGGAKMVITVDCGVTAIAEAKLARELGVELIVTDHHEPSAAGLPDAACIVHPALSGSYPNPRLCGAGVAMKLAWAIGQSLTANTKVSDPFRKFLLQAVTLAALGTVADVVPLLGENRILVTHGLRAIKQTGLPGLDALIDSAGLRTEKVDSYHVGFTLAPRLNAAGRMDEAHNVVELFTLADPARSKEIADYLEQHNRQRQETERAIFKQAVEKFEADPGFRARRSIVLADESWHPGVVGIVASRMVERYCRPCVLIGIQNGIGQGSARSINAGLAFNINEALRACGEHLASFGGHAMAGGLKIARDRIESFAAAFEDYARRCLTEEDLQPTLRVEAVVTAADLDLDTVRQVKALAPFGQGNPTPVLVAEGCRLANPPRRVGRDGSHLQFHVRVGDRVFKAIAFGGAHWEQPLGGGRPFDIAFGPSINTYQGISSVELCVSDIRWT
ncbi:MAG: single-stranded-DNA-specific exonuclease RecJ [Phycisphaerae bacterium]|nr:single-stranded-DNA-specific exonuclease RecJ [Phycisphaerae bacterium]